MAGEHGFVVLNKVGILTILARRNISHAKVARMLRTTPNYWSQLLNHHRRPSAEMRRRISSLRVFRGHIGPDRQCRWEDIFTMEVPILDV